MAKRKDPLLDSEGSALGKRGKVGAPRTSPIHDIPAGTELSKPAGKAPLNDEDEETGRNEKPVVEEPDPFFGPPGSAGLFKQGEDEEEYPDDVLQAMEEHGFRNLSYVCELKRIPDGSNNTSSGSTWIHSWKQAFPSIEWIAKRYGPGRYMLVFRWRKKELVDGEKKTRAHIIEVPLAVSDDYMEEYEQAQFERAIARAKKRRSAVKQAQLSKALEFDARDLGIGGEEQQDAKENALAYIREIAGIGEMLGWKTGGGGGGGMTEVLKAIGPSLGVGIAAVVKMMMEARQEQNKMLMLLMNKQDSSGQLIEMMKVMGRPDSTKQIEDYHNMVSSILDLKGMVQGEKKTAVDKVLEAVERVMPMVLAMASMPKPVREANPMYNAAKAYVNSSPEFQEVLGDPRQRVEMVNRLDNYFGWEQTNYILTVAGVERPEECTDYENRKRTVEDGEGEKNELASNTGIEPQG